MANSLDIRLSIEFDELVTCSEAFLKCAVAFDQDEVIAEDFDGMKEGTVGNLESRRNGMVNLDDVYWKFV